MKRKVFTDKEYKLKIGSNVRKWRNLKGIKQKELAMTLQLSEAAISNIENDVTDVSLRQLEDIASAIEISVEQLFNDPQETFIVAPINDNGIEKKDQPLEKELLNAVLSSMQKKDEQLQAIMQNVLHTMSALIQEDRK